MAIEIHDPIQAVDRIYRKATACRVCFDGPNARRSGIIDVAQPRIVGNRYADAYPRVVFVLLNPGSGMGKLLSHVMDVRPKYHGYRDGTVTLDELFDTQRDGLATWWGDYKMGPFYTTGLGLNIEEIAMVNAALCATADNKRGKAMVRECLSRHTAEVIRALDPDLIVLSGSEVWQERYEISKACPKAEIVTMLHYAHRKGAKRGTESQREVRETIERIRAAKNGQ